MWKLLAGEDLLRTAESPTIHFIMATDGKMSESSKMPRFTFVLILAVSLIAIVFVASQKYGQSRGAGTSLLDSTADVEPPAGNQQVEPTTEAGPDSANHFSLTSADANENVEASLLGDVAPPNEQPEPPTASSSDAETSDTESDVEQPDDDTTDEQATGADDAGQRDPRKALSRQFARRRAAKAKEAERVTVSVPTIIHEPQVWLSDEHQKLCLVGVGDAMPKMQLAKGSETVALEDALGESYTVVVFWSVTNPFAVEQFTHLATDVVHPFSGAKLKAIAVHVGQPQKVYDDLCKNRGKDITCLLDADKSNFAKIATRKLPRTYLLDAQGKIIWFDIEYSRTTRHERLNAVQYHLQGQKITSPNEASPDEVDEQAK